MKRLTYILIVGIVLLPSVSHALKRFSLGVGGRISYPMYWNAHIVNLRAFPIPGNSLFTRLGCEVEIVRFGEITDTHDKARYVLFANLPFRLLIMLYPNSIENVGRSLKKSPYVFLFGEICLGNCYNHYLNNSQTTSNYSHVLSLDGGIALSFMNLVEFEAGYTKKDINELLVVDLEGRFAEYKPSFIINRFYAGIKLSLNSVLLSSEEN